MKLTTTRLSFGLLVTAIASFLCSLYFSSRLSLGAVHGGGAGVIDGTSHDAAIVLNRFEHHAAAVYSKKLKELLNENRKLRLELQGSKQSHAAVISNKTLATSMTAGATVNDVCDAAFAQTTKDQTPGLSPDSIRRSRANWGHSYRLDQLAQTLTRRQRPLQVVAFGGSITVAHGVVRNLTYAGSDSYTGHLEHWLNEHYPILNVGNSKGQKQRQTNALKRHRVYNMAQHGSDSCALAKRMTSMIEFLRRSHEAFEEPDMILLEYSVNDYQGQDHVDHAVSKLDVFFQGFQDIALCAEAVVYKLLTEYPNAAVVFVEFRTAILERKTAQMLHMGVAQHYQIPVISYGDAVFPEFFELVNDKLNISDRYTVPIGETLLPFPYGCHECKPEHIIDQFRYSFNPQGVKKCRTVCDLMMYAGYDCDFQALPPPGRDYCYSPLFAVDAVHPSALGHRIANDLIVHALATAVKENCQRQRQGIQQSSSLAIRPQVLPPSGWLGTPKALLTRSNFVMVRDADCLTYFCNTLLPVQRTPGFTLYSDSRGFLKLGWIATNSSGGETIDFEIDLPERPCYVVYLAILRSYSSDMGQMQVTVIDKTTGNGTSAQLDSLWEPKISVWSDNQITSDETPACTGQCILRVETLPQLAERTGNKVKILT
ncbi:hypothetical protein MPSEU_000582400 [Mayamaea pseudoterrestris]|nr:hypothetical protein MPSEU_000582400 [Mayamaea pseudoterrestris]